MKNKLKLFILPIIILLILSLEFLKNSIFNMEFILIDYIFKVVFTLVLCVINNLKFLKYRFMNNLINIFLIIISILFVLFDSFNLIGITMFYAFILLITYGFMVIFNKKFEVSLVSSVTVLILLFVLISIFGLLKYSYIFLFLIIAPVLIYLFKNRENCNDKFKDSKSSLIIFSILFLVAILSGVGRYVHKWDEYSYWGYAAKVLIHTDSLKSMISSMGTLSGYPPVSSVWHYIVSLFLGYSEPNLYIGLTLLTFIYMMPVFVKSKKNNIVLLCICSVGFPFLFNGSITYTLLYVDLLLGAMCSSAIVLEDYLDDGKDKKIIIYLILSVITLLKANGFVFASCLILLFMIKKIINSKELSFKFIFSEMKKHCLVVLLVLFIFVLWNVFSKLTFDDSFCYLYKLIPMSLSTDIMNKLNPTFIINFISALFSSFDDPILYSFINVPLFVFLVIVFLAIYTIDKKEKKYNLIQSLLPYFIFYIVFYLLTAVSLFIMFTYYEASQLASFSRYLAPINISLIAYCLYKSSYVFENDERINLVYISIISLIGFSYLTFFVTDIKDRRETIHIKQYREQIFQDINEIIKDKSKIFIINQEDSESIMPLWYARYYCYPHIVNANSNAITWKILTKSNEWDLEGWGLTVNDFEKHIIEYKFDYVFIYTWTEELYEELKKGLVINDDIDFNVSKLFKVRVLDENSIKLIPIEEKENN